MELKNIQHLLEVGDTLNYIDTANFQTWTIVELFEGGFTAKDDYETKDYFYDELQTGWQVSHNSLKRITLNPNNIHFFVTTEAIIYTPKGLTFADIECIKDDKNLIFYFNDGCDYTIAIERDEENEPEVTAYYGESANRGKYKTFDKSTFEENKKWAINWGRKAANDVLGNGYN